MVFGQLSSWITFPEGGGATITANHILPVVLVCPLVKMSVHIEAISYVAMMEHEQGFVESIRMRQPVRNTMDFLVRATNAYNSIPAIVFAERPKQAFIGVTVGFDELKN